MPTNIDVGLVVTFVLITEAHGDVGYGFAAGRRLKGVSVTENVLLKKGHVRGLFIVGV